jgi:hypothetical protein
MTDVNTVETVDAKKRSLLEAEAIREHTASQYESEKAEVTSVRETASKLHKDQPPYSKDANFLYQYPVAGYGKVNSTIASLKLADGSISACSVPVQEYYGISEEILRVNIAFKQIKTASDLAKATKQLCEVTDSKPEDVALLIHGKREIDEDNAVRPKNRETKAGRKSQKATIEKQNQQIAANRSLLIETYMETLEMAEAEATALADQRIAAKVEQLAS